MDKKEIEKAALERYPIQLESIRGGNTYDINADRRKGFIEGINQIITDVYMALGEASMCWSEIPKGVFDDVNANKIGKDLVYKILALSQPKEVDLIEKATDVMFEHAKRIIHPNLSSLDVSDILRNGANTNKEVDLEELRNLFHNWAIMQNKDILTHDDVFNWFLPNLQKPVESDAVELKHLNLKVSVMLIQPIYQLKTRAMTLFYLLTG